jgi:4-hydroxybenzoyl-CoA reductase subunit beta
MTLPPFQLHRPRTIHDATRLLAEHRDEARLLAGGTDLVVNLRHRLATPRHVVHLGAIRELGALDGSRERGLRVGAMATIADLAGHAAVRALFPVLSRAAAAVSGPTLRNMGTVGGNICLDTRCQWYNQSHSWRRACGFCLKKDGDLCHVAPASSVCWAAYAGDLAPAFLVLDAQVVARSVRGERVIPLHRFFLEDGARRLDLAADEIVTEVRVPPERVGLRGYYGKLRLRGSVDYPLCGVSIAGTVSGGRFRDVTAAVTAVGPRPFLVDGVRESLEGRRVDDDEAIERAADLARRAANPMHTDGAVPPAYRRLRLGLFARDGLRELAKCSLS